MIPSSVRISKIKCFKRKKKHTKNTKINNNEKQVNARKRQIKILQLFFLTKMEYMLTFCFYQFVGPEKKVVVL